jgi:proteasome lid subunit RPN8/RPN11
MISTKEYLKVLAHAKAEYPKESCGVIVSTGEYIPCTNIAGSDSEFIISYEELDSLGKEILKYIHSHPTTAPIPSEADKQGMQATGVPWGIISPNTGDYFEYLPDNTIPPLIGREFKFGSMDCYSIVRDYYKLTYNIDLINPTREDSFWELGKSYYIDYYEAAGFIKVIDLKIGDVILMTIGASIPNHAAVYLGDERMIHHIQNRLSSEDIYSGYWVKRTVGYYRHKDTINEKS